MKWLMVAPLPFKWTAVLPFCPKGEGYDKTGTSEMGSFFRLPSPPLPPLFPTEEPLINDTNPPSPYPYPVEALSLCGKGSRSKYPGQPLQSCIFSRLQQDSDFRRGLLDSNTYSCLRAIDRRAYIPILIPLHFIRPYSAPLFHSPTWLFGVTVPSGGGPVGEERSFSD